MASESDPTGAKEPIEQIVIEKVTERDGSLGWIWNAFGTDLEVANGAASTLSELLDSMREYLRDEGIAP